MSWNTIKSASSYNIYRGNFLLSTSSISSFTDLYVISSNSFSYTVSAVNSFGQSQQSSPVTITATAQFTSLTPNIMPNGTLIENQTTRYYYFLFTPISTSLDAYISYGGKNTNMEAIIGLYDVQNPSINYLNNTTITNLDSNIGFKYITLGTATILGLQMLIQTEYNNSTTQPNFTLSNLIGDLTAPNAILKTYILEVVSVNNQNTNIPDLSVYFKNGVTGYNTRLNYNSVSWNRKVPSPYVMGFDFSQMTQPDYSTYIYPYLYIFQNVINIITSIISTSPNARIKTTYDMLIGLNVSSLEKGVLGQSSISDWSEDNTRSPDFPSKQNITYSKTYFDNGYLLGPSNFNGVSVVNGRTNILLFNVLLHEIHHGLGISYINAYNTTNQNVGWNKFIQLVSPTDPWYTGSTAVDSYKICCQNTSLLRVPIEPYFGEGTALTHWYYGDSSGGQVLYRNFQGIYHPALSQELMTGFITNSQYLTRLTAGALTDYGYNTNLNNPYISPYPFNQIPVQKSQLLIQCDHSKQGRKLYVHEDEIQIPEENQNIVYWPSRRYNGYNRHPRHRRHYHYY